MFRKHNSQSKKIKKKGNKKRRKTRCKKGGSNNKLDDLSQTIEAMKFLMELNLDQQILSDSLSLAREKKPYDENNNVAKTVREKRRQRENEEKSHFNNVGGTRKKSRKRKNKTARKH